MKPRCERFEDDPVFTGLVDSLLSVRTALWQEYLKLHKLLIRVVGREEVCRRFTRVPGVGPVTALTYYASVDDPARLPSREPLARTLD